MSAAFYAAFVCRQTPLAKSCGQCDATTKGAFAECWFCGEHVCEAHQYDHGGSGTICIACAIHEYLIEECKVCKGAALPSACDNCGGKGVVKA